MEEFGKVICLIINFLEPNNSDEYELSMNLNKSV